MQELVFARAFAAYKCTYTCAIARLWIVRQCINPFFKVNWLLINSSSIIAAKFATITFLNILFQFENSFFNLF